MTDRSHSHRTPWTCLILISLLALALRWPGTLAPKFHPDEYPIGRWLTWMQTHTFIEERLYANGFFVLTRPVYAATAWLAPRLQYLRAVQAPREEATPETAVDPVIFARYVNVGLGIAACWILFALVRRVTGSRALALFSATLMAVSRYPVEHSHYGETDMAMLVTLLLALWAMALALDRRRAWLLLPAGFLAGVATGTKFPLGLLLLPLACTVGVVASRPGCRPTRAILHTIGWLPATALLFGAGFAWTNPGITRWSWFLTELQRNSARVYAETRLNLGPALGEPHIRFWTHLHQGWSYAQSMGLIGLTLAGLGLLLFVLCRGSHRRFWPLYLALPIALATYWLRIAPWVRSQEFMMWIPWLALAGVLPLHRLSQSGSRFARLAAPVIALAALATPALEGWRTAALFAQPDTRLAVDDWLARHMPEDAGLAAEFYAGRQMPETRRALVVIKKMEAEGIDSLRTLGVDYLLRAASDDGRGLTHPVTGQWYPPFLARNESLTNTCRRLACWAPLPPQSWTSFISPAVELWSLHEQTAGVTPALVLSRPMWVRDEARTLHFPGSRVGTATAVMVDRRPRHMAVGAAAEPASPLYGVLWTAERPATALVSGAGPRRMFRLEPYAMAWFTLPPQGPHSLRPYQVLTVRTAPEPHIVYLPCYFRIAESADDLARQILDMDAAEAAGRLLDDPNLAPALLPSSRYLLAVRSRRWNLARAWRHDALETLKALDQALVADPRNVKLLPGHISGSDYEAFARFRYSSMLDASVARVQAQPGQNADRLVQDIDLSVILPPGHYEASFDMSGRTLPDPAEGPLSLVADAPGAGGPLEIPLSCLKAPGWSPVSFPFNSNGRDRSDLAFLAPRPLTFHYRNLQVRWHLADRLTWHREEIALAISREMRAAGEVPPPDLLEPASFWPAHEHARRVQQLAHTEGAGLDPASAARAVLQEAPGHWPALQILARSGDPAASAAVASLSSNACAPVRFDGRVRLVGLAMDPAARRLRCVLEAEAENLPRLAVAVAVRHRRHWKEIAATPLPAPFRQGERIVIECPLPEAPEGPLALGIRTDVTWKAGYLPVSGPDNDTWMPLETRLTPPSPHGAPAR